MLARQACVILMLILCSSLSVFGQKIKGKITHNTADVTGVHVQNTSLQKTTITNAKGYFEISAKVNDTLVFTAVQFKPKQLVVTAELLTSKLVLIPMDEVLNALDEVVLTPYNLSGELATDLASLKTEQVINAVTVGLPNAGVKPILQSERMLHDADHGKFVYYYGIGFTINVNKILTRLSGKTKMLKERVERDKAYIELQEIIGFYSDTLFVHQLKIPKTNIEDFMSFCAVDPSYEKLVGSNDKIKLWTFIRQKSVIYRKNNTLD